MAVFFDSSLKTKPLRIFVVGNYRITAEYLRAYLELLGHTVVHAENAAQALTKMPLAKCDVLLCDICLPDGSGWDLLLESEEQLFQPVSPVVTRVCATEEDPVRSEQAGFFYHFNHPIDPAELEAVLDQAGELLAGLPRDETMPTDKLFPGARTTIPPRLF